MNKILNFKKIVSIGFFAAFLAVFLLAGAAQAGFWDWFNIGGDSQQAAVRGSKTYRLRVNKSGLGSTYGRITSADGKINCGYRSPRSGCSARYTSAQSVTLTVVSESDNYSFDKWRGGGCSGSGSCIVEVNKPDGEVSVWAVFKKVSVPVSESSSSSSSSSSKESSSSSSSSVQQHTLEVKISGIGKIAITSGSRSKYCVRKIDLRGKEKISGDCSVKFNEGESVTLAPSIPDTRYEFATWADACRGSEGITSCTITMSDNKTVSATFNKRIGGESVAAISVRKAGNGAGKVVSLYYIGRNSGEEDGRINCGSDCSENYGVSCGDYNGQELCETLYLKAVAEEGSYFKGWKGACEVYKRGNKEKAGECYVTLKKPMTIIAEFKKGYYDLTVTVSEGGTVTSLDKKINCGSGNSNCKYSYKENNQITLKAIPNVGYVYEGGNNVCLGNNNNKGIYTCKVKMMKNQDLTVNFKASAVSSSSSTSAKPTATTGSATNITSTSATLNGSVNPKGENVSYTFTYYDGQTGRYTSTNLVDVGNNGSNDIAFTLDISDLSPGTKYNYYFYVWPKKDWRYVPRISGGVKSFTTLSDSSQSAASVDLNVTEVKPGGQYGSTASSITLTGNNSVILTWTVSAVKDCSISYDSNAKTIRSGTLFSSDIINESGADGKSGDTRKHNTYDYFLSGGSSSATYTLSCQKNSDNSAISDTVTVNY